MNIVILICLVCGTPNKRTIEDDTAEIEPKKQKESGIVTIMYDELLSDSNLKEKDINPLNSIIYERRIAENKLDVFLGDDCNREKGLTNGNEDNFDINEITTSCMIEDDFLAFLDDKYLNDIYTFKNLNCEGIFDLNIDKYELFENIQPHEKDIENDKMLIDTVLAEAKEIEIISGDKKSETESVFTSTNEKVCESDEEIISLTDQVMKFHNYCLPNHLHFNKTKLQKKVKTLKFVPVLEIIDEEEIQLGSVDVKTETNEKNLSSDEKILDLFDSTLPTESENSSLLEQLLCSSSFPLKNKFSVEPQFMIEKTGPLRMHIKFQNEIDNTNVLNDIIKSLVPLRSKNIDYGNYIKEKLKYLNPKDDNDIFKLIIRLDMYFFCRIYHLNRYLKVEGQNINPCMNTNDYFNINLMKKFEEFFIKKPFYRLKVSCASNLTQAINNFNKSVKQSIDKIRLIFLDGKKNYLSQLLTNIPNKKKNETFSAIILMILESKKNKPLFELFPELHIIKEKIIRKDYQTDYLKSIHQILTIILLQFEYYKENLLDAYKIENKDSKIVCKIILSIRFLILSIFLECENPKFITLHTFVLLFLNYLRCANKKLFLTLGLDDFIYENVFYMRLDEVILKYLKNIPYRIDKNSDTIKMIKMALNFRLCSDYFRNCFIEYFLKNGFEHLMPDFYDYHRKKNHIKIIETFNTIKKEWMRKFCELVEGIR